MATDSGDGMPVQLEKARVNIWNVGGFLLLAVSTAYGWGSVAEKMRANDATSAASIASLSSEIKDIKAQLPALARLQFEQTRSVEATAETRKGLEEVNKRIDRVVESWNGKLDTIGTNVNKLVTQVEVLSTRIPAQPQQRTMLLPPKP